MNDLAKQYIDEKEAHYRYGYSRAWFQRARWQGDGPPYLKIKNKVLYPLDQTDFWFSQHGLKNSTSQQNDYPYDNKTLDY